jgi:hypothetical protein
MVHLCLHDVTWGFKQQTSLGASGGSRGPLPTSCQRIGICQFPPWAHSHDLPLHSAAVQKWVGVMGLSGLSFNNIYIYIIYIIRDTMINLISHWIEWGARVWIRAKNGKHMQRLKIHEKPGFCTGNWDARRSILFLSGRTSSVFSPSSILKPRLYPPYRTKRLNPTTNGFMPKMGRVWVKNWMINDRYGH